MKKSLILCFVMGLLLTGCASEPVFETVTDVYAQPEPAAAARILADLPEDAAVMTMESRDAGKICLCDGYTVTIQTTQAGDLSRTLQNATGYPREELTVLETKQNDCRRYDCVWTSAGEGGDQVGRLAVLDDGNYHYVLTVMADAQTAGQLSDTWRQILDSFTLENTAP